MPSEKMIIEILGIGFCLLVNYSHGKSDKRWGVKTRAYEKDSSHFMKLLILPFYLHLFLLPYRVTCIPYADTIKLGIHWQGGLHNY